MPIIDVSVLEGRDDQTLQRLATELHQTITGVLGVPDETVRILIREVPASRWVIGGIPVSVRRGGGGPAGPTGPRDCTTVPGGDVSAV